MEFEPHKRPTAKEIIAQLNDLPDQPGAASISDASTPAAVGLSHD